MATLNSVSRGALRQDLSTTQEAGFSLHNGNDRTAAVFRTSAFLNPPNTGGTQYFTNFRNAWGGVLGADPRYVTVVERDSLDNVVAVTTAQIVDIDRFLDQNGRFSGVLELDMTVSQNWIINPSTDSTRFTIRLEERVPVTALEPVTFTSDVILPGSANVSVLGTDANGRIIPGQGGSRYTSGDTFQTEGPDSANPGQMIRPSQGDFHNLTANIGGGTTTALRAVNVTTGAGGTARFVNYGTATDVFADFRGLGFFNIEINGDRTLMNPQLTGVQGNTHSLWWRRNGSTLDSDWTEIGSVVDSTPNGNTSRVRVSTTRSDGSVVTIDEMRLISDLDELGVDAPTNATTMGGGVDIDAGLFIYDGSEWQRFEVPVGSVGTGAGVNISLTGTGGTTVERSGEDYTIDSVLYKSGLQIPAGVGTRIDTDQSVANSLQWSNFGQNFRINQPNPRILTGDIISIVVFNDLSAQVQRASLLNYTVADQNATFVFIGGQEATDLRNALGLPANQDNPVANDFTFRGPVLPLVEPSFDLTGTEFTIDTGLDWVPGDRAYLADTARGNTPSHYVNIDVVDYEPDTGILTYANPVQIIGAGAETVDLRDFEINYSVPTFVPTEFTFADTGNNGNILGVDFDVTADGVVTGTVNATGFTGGGGTGGGSPLTVIGPNGGTPISTDVTSITFAGAEVSVTEPGNDGIITVTVTGETFDDSTQILAQSRLGIDFTEVGNSVSAVTTPITAEILDPIFADSANSGNTLGVDFTRTGNVFTASVDAQSIADLAQTVAVREVNPDGTEVNSVAVLERLEFPNADYNVAVPETGVARVNLVPMPASTNGINYTDTNVQVAVNNNVNDAREGGSVLFENVATDLAWQNGQVGYSYSGDLATLFTFTVTAYDSTGGTLSGTIDSVIRTDDRAHGRYLIFAGAPTAPAAPADPSDPTPPPTVNIPELSTVSVGSGNVTLEVYTVNVLEDADGRKSMPTNQVDGDFVIVHNNTTSNINIDGGNYTLGVGESVTFVWHQAGTEWVVTSDAKNVIAGVAGIYYTDTDTFIADQASGGGFFTLTGGNITNDDEGRTITFDNVESDLAWQVGQQGYSYSDDLETLFTFTVTAYNPTQNTLSASINDVVRTDNQQHGRYLIFAGAPSVSTTVTTTGTTSTTVDVPELGTFPAVRDNGTLGVYALYLIGNDLSTPGRTDFTGEVRRLPRSNGLSDGDFIIVKNQKTQPVVINRRGENIDGHANSLLLRPNETVKLVWSTVPEDYATQGGNIPDMGWITTSDFGTELIDVNGTDRLILSGSGSDGGGTGIGLYHHTANRPINSTDVGSNTWSVTHNLNNRNPIVQIYEETSNASGIILTGSMVLPDEINIIDENNLTITFSTNVAGTATVLG